MAKQLNHCSSASSTVILSSLPRLLVAITTGHYDSRSRRWKIGETCQKPRTKVRDIRDFFLLLESKMGLQEILEDWKFKNHWFNRWEGCVRWMRKYDKVNQYFAGVFTNIYCFLIIFFFVKNFEILLIFF